jgi:hypothetical protein
MIIKDGVGRGYTTAVTSENRVCTDSVVVLQEQHTNNTHAKSFSLPFDAIDPAGADDYFFYIKNTGTKNLHLTDIRLRSTVAGVVEVHGVTGTPTFTAGTDVTPVNRTLGSANTVLGTFKTDTDTTGLTSSGILFYMKVDPALSGEDTHLKTTSHVIVPPGQSIALLWDTATGVLSGIISIHENQNE